MSLSSVFSIASSGLAAASLRLQVSANNVANASSTGPLPDAANAGNFPPAYVPQRIDQVSVAGGGTAATVGTVSPSYVTQYDPTAPFADNNGQVAAPNVDLANEVVQQIIARYEFAANAKVLQVGSEMMKSLLDIKA
ncbi:MAG TPA: flagellar basal body rod C-terminal domain-containing protein [Xanthobacteraceae bacterium]